MDDKRIKTDLSNSSDSEPTLRSSEALNIIEKLSEGINPLSDEPLAPNSTCLDEDIQQALQIAIPALQARIRWIERQAQLPDNAGKPWKTEEDDRLSSGFESGDSVDILADRHQRTKGSITSRLIKQGKISA